jgi:hypothetical protein
MELPSDVLAIVREFSRPRMPYYKQYKQVMLELGHENDDWPAVRERLCDPDGALVLKAFLEYKDCYVETDKLKRKLDSERSYIHIPCYYDLSKLMGKRDKMLRSFKILLVGEEVILAYERENDGLYD